MPDTWGNLEEPAREVLRGRALRGLPRDALDRRISRDDLGRVRFRVFGGRAAPGAPEALDGEDFAVGPPPPEEVTLIDPEDFDYELEISAEDVAWAQPIDAALAPLQDYFARDPAIAEGEGAPPPDATLPAVVDHRPQQSPVKHQGKQRSTCVAHASLGLLEAAQHVPDDLSEQYAHYKFLEFLGRPHDRDRSLRTTDAPGFLARADGRICLEQEWAYIPDQSEINKAVAAGTYGPPASAVGDQTYGYRSSKLIVDSGLEGESIKNTRFLESLLALGFDIVIGVWASWDDEDNRAILRPLLDGDKPLGGGGHAMLVVGYERPAGYFILKNSWGPGWGHAGYGYFHYDFIRACAKYGFTVSEREPPKA